MSNYTKTINYEATSKGLFMDGKPIVPEFGNADHIKALRKFEKRSEALRGDGLEIEDVEWEVTAKFKCVCGCYISETKQDTGDMDLSTFESDMVECRSCGQEYEFFTDEFNELRVKI